ncbi:MAG: GNAT family N-acetyltransferase [Burkholderiales bacterium]|nr:GNAT family N-acetyltransferase [Burkholderiales bacterium]
MSILVPMTAESYATFWEAAVSGYAEQNIACGRWPAERALERSRAEHDKLLPQGLDTPDHYLFDIRDLQSNTLLGSLWVAEADRAGVRIAFVYAVRIFPAFRRQGHAKRAFKALESFVKGLGLSTIGLHVFAFNTEARALYESLGYEVTSLNMHKYLNDASY